MSLFIGSLYAILQTLEKQISLLRSTCHLETDMKKLFQSEKK